MADSSRVGQNKDALPEQTSVPSRDTTHNASILSNAVTLPNPENSTFYLRKGYFLWKLRHYIAAMAAYEEALSLCEQALHRDSNSAMAYQNKAIALSYLGRQEDAERERKKARDLETKEL